MRLDYSIGPWNGSQDPACRQSAGVCQTFSGKFCILKHEPGGCRTKEKRCLRLIALPARRVREVLWECPARTSFAQRCRRGDASSHRFRPNWCAWPINMRGAQLPTLISSVKRQAYTECGVAGASPARSAHAHVTRTCVRSGSTGRRFPGWCEAINVGGIPCHPSRRSQARRMALPGAASRRSGAAPPLAPGFESNARSGFVKSVYSFKTDRIKVPDDF